MRKLVLCIIAVAAFLPAFSQSTNPILQTKIGTLICFRDADNEIQKVADQFKLKFKYNKERMVKYVLNYDFMDANLGDFLEKVCKVTNSHYFIGNDNTIYLLGRTEKYTPEVEKALVASNKSEQVRLHVDQPRKRNVTITGKVTDQASGETIPNVSISVRGTNISTFSNVDGHFILYNIPSDTAIIDFTTIGYMVYQQFLSPSERLDSLQIGMQVNNNMLNEVFIVGKQTQSFKLNQKVSMIKLTPAMISALPNIGEKDVFRAFQLMPGISAANENTSGLYVRGGTPDQNLVLYDGFTVYNVEHLFGFFSAFNGNAIKDISLYKGGFESKYGGRLSSVVDINGKDGSSKHFNAGVDLSMLSFNTFLEGKISKKITGIFNFRRSFKTSLYDKIYEKFAKTANSQVAAPQNQGRRNSFNNSTQNTKSFFYDLNTKITWRPTNKDAISLSVYNGNDHLDNSITPSIPGFLQNSGRAFGLEVTDVTGWGNTGASLKWSRKWNDKIFINTLLSYSNYFSIRDNTSSRSNTDSNGLTTVTRTGTLENNDLKDYSFKSDMEIKLNKNHFIESGVQLTKNIISYSYAQNDTSKIIDRNTQGGTGALYLQDKINMFKRKLQIIPGIRSTFFSPTSQIYIEPRFNITYDINNEWKLKGSVGRYYQFIKRITREDILQNSRDFWALADSSKLPVSFSDQLIAGFSWENNQWLVDVEAYSKKLSGLSEYSQRFSYDRRKVSFTENYFQGSGFSRGIDILVQKKFGNYTGWIGYTLGEVKNQFIGYSESPYYAVNDVRHEFKNVHSYKWLDWEFAVTFIFATGKPYTAPAGGYSVTLLDGTMKTFINVTDKNANRLPYYNRMDISATYNIQKIFGGKGSLSLSIFNVYNKTNVWYKNYTIVGNSVIATDVNYLGITPNLTFSYHLK